MSVENVLTALRERDGRRRPFVPIITSITPTQPNTTFDKWGADALIGLRDEGYELFPNWRGGFRFLPLQIKSSLAGMKQFVYKPLHQVQRIPGVPGIVVLNGRRNPHQLQVDFTSRVLCLANYRPSRGGSRMDSLLQRCFHPEILDEALKEIGGAGGTVYDSRNPVFVRRFR